MPRKCGCLAAAVLALNIAAAEPAPPMAKPAAAKPAAVAKPAVPTAELKPGLLGEYYAFEHDLADFPSVERLKPCCVRVDKLVYFEATESEFNWTGLTDRFYVRWSGKLRISKAGKFTFFTESDDGSRLSIDGKAVLDNGGLHSMQEVSGAVELSAGDHDILLEFFENGGGAGCKLLWSTEGAKKSVVSANALFHPRAAEFDKAGKSRLAAEGVEGWEF